MRAFPWKTHAGRMQQGLTLIEILVALVVVGVGVGTFVKLQRNASARLSANGSLMRAGQLVERHMEGIRIQVARDTLAFWPPRDTVVTEGRIRLVRRISTAHSPAGGRALPNVRKVDLIVSWGSGHQDSLEISSYVTRRF